MSYLLSFHGVKSIVVDEMNAWFKTEDFKNLGRLTRYIYALFLTEEVKKSLKRMCKGCRTGHDSRDEHICIDPQPSLDPFMLYIHVEALRSVDRLLAESTFHRTVRILGWDSDKPRQDFMLHLNDLFRNWYVSDFATLEQCINVEPSISDAVNRARGNLGTN